MFSTQSEKTENGNDRKFSKRVENTMGKGEIARHEQFSFLTVFLKDLYCRHIKTRPYLAKGCAPFFPDKAKIRKPHSSGRVQILWICKGLSSSFWLSVP